MPGTGKLAASLDSTHASFETPCGSYAHFKITRYLLGLTGDSRYGDSMERVLYNTILGASPMQPDGRAFYYSDYHPQAVKVFAKDKWPCCSGTFPQIAADYRISAYFLGGEQRGLYVNLYVPSTVTWLDPATGTKFSLLQTTQYPYAPNIRFDVMATKAATFSLYLRIPQWADDAAVTLNQVRDSRKLVPGSFAEIRRGSCRAGGTAAHSPGRHGSDCGANSQSCRAIGRPVGADGCACGPKRLVPYGTVFRSTSPRARPQMVGAVRFEHFAFAAVRRY